LSIRDKLLNRDDLNRSSGEQRFPFGNKRCDRLIRNVCSVRVDGGVANRQLVGPLDIEVLMKLELLDQDVTVAFEPFEIALDLGKLSAYLRLAYRLGFKEVDLRLRIIQSL